ncbi:MAG: P27 family phage terminase small subunit [Pirellulaceae bacterium]
MTRKIPPADRNWCKDARELWRAVHSEFLLQTHHEILLRQACCLLTTANAAREKVAEVGLTITDRYGTVKPNPLLETERASINAVRLVMRELGLDTDGKRADEQVRIHRTKGYA